MPRVLFSYPTTTLFTIDRAVGRNAPNDRLDVLLVQFLLFLYDKVNYVWMPADPIVPRGLRVANPVPAGPFLTHPKPPGKIIIDGVCGDQTIGFIEYFQEQMQLQNKRNELNGLIAPAQTKGLQSMTLLNQASRASNQPWVLNQSDVFPIELSSSFFV